MRSENVNAMFVKSRCIGVCVILLTTVWLTGCPAQEGAVTSRPSSLVVWGDPDNPDSQGTAIRDWSNSSSEFVVVGTDGRVQFADGGVCTVCEADVDNAVIRVDGNAIDILFGVHPDGDDVRRPYLVDSAANTFVDLGGGGGEAVTFTPTTEAFPDPDGNNRAVAVGTQSNAGNAAQRSTGLCGIVGALGLGFLLLAPIMGWRRRR
jgi:hypothetical protein